MRMRIHVVWRLLCYILYTFRTHSHSPMHAIYSMVDLWRQTDWMSLNSICIMHNSSVFCEHVDNFSFHSSHVARGQSRILHSSSPLYCKSMYIRVHWTYIHLRRVIGCCCTSHPSSLFNPINTLYPTQPRAKFQHPKLRAKFTFILCVCVCPSRRQRLLLLLLFFVVTRVFSSVYSETIFQSAGGEWAWQHLANVYDKGSNWA